jgi:GT2 family glycosyltransferase
MDERPEKTAMVAVATCGRPAFLRNCLAAIQQLEAPPEVRIEVLLVDNNAGGDARPLFEEVAVGAHHPLHYAHVPERGIVNVRNRAVDVALERGVDLLGFLDDDGIVDPRWLIELLEVMETTHADVVGGPAEFLYPEGSPEWLPRFMDGSGWPTGLLAYEGFHTLPATRNVVFRTHLLREWGLRFRDEFNLTGGEDTFFFEEARRKGAVISWAAEARIREEFPASRANLRWFLQRRYRHGSTRITFFELLEEHPSRSQLGRELMRNVWSACVSRPLGKAWRWEWDQDGWIRNFGDMADSMGGFLAFLGFEYAEYRTIHGQ